jgi:CBS domain-containing protein
MRVRLVMTRHPVCCTPATTLGAAAVLMAESACGTLPVVSRGRTVGMITDRDICVGLGAAQCSPNELPVADVMTSPIHVCRENDNLGAALETMQRERIRRLPVLDDCGTLVGILSIDDVLGRSGTVATLPDREIVEAYRAICSRAGEGESPGDGA